MTLVTPLPFPLQLNDGMRLTTLGDAVIYFTRLSEKQQQTHYWQRAIRMFNTAVAEPTYLRTATICLQTALLMDGRLSDPQTVPELRPIPTVVVDIQKERTMANNKNPNEEQPGEKPPGKYHYNPGNMSGKVADVYKDESEQENNRDTIESRDEPPHER